MTTDEFYLARTLALAARAEGHVAPNPLVGCVIIGPEGQVLAEGYHKKFGGLHAEVEAIAALPEGQTLEGCTVYVSLEPCSHHGKNPPCADKLVQMRPARVVAATHDPNPLVGGQGFAKLRAAGIDVQEGPLQREALVQNRRFVTRFWQKRPFVTLKWAQTDDGYLARADYTSKWITSQEARAEAHRARGRHQAIAVGYRTALHDNPKLDTRLWPGPNPVRVVLDPHQALPSTLQVFTDGGPTLHLYQGTPGLIPQHLEGYLPLAVDAAEGWPQAMLAALGQAGLQSVLIEGGAAVLNQFVAANLWDEALVFTAPVHFGPGGIAAPRLVGAQVLQHKKVGVDTLTTYGNIRQGFWARLQVLAPAEGTDTALGYL